ncbi:MAG: hypothetical protein WCZ19_05465 [Acholeplasma sp.]
MRKKDIKYIIKSDIEAHIPNQAPKMDFARIESLRQLDEKFVQIPSKPQGKVFGLRMAMSLVLIGILSIGIWIYSDNQNGGEALLPSGKEILEQDKEVLSLSFLSTAALLPTQNEQPIVQPLSLSLNTPVATNNQPGSPMDNLKPFLSLIESVITGGHIPQLEIRVSDKPAYETYVRVQTVDLLGLPVHYDMYYNVTAYQKSDDETTFEIEGLISKGQVLYLMYGKKEIEDDEQEISIRSFINESEYIETVYKAEDESSEYSMTHVRQGVMIYESKLDIEFEDDEIEINLEVTTEHKVSNYKMSYEVEDDRPLIEIAFEIEDLIDDTKISGEMKVYVAIDQISNLSQYEVFITIEDETYEETYDRDDDLDDEENDDEDDEDNDDETDNDKDADDDDETEDSNYQI